MRPLENLSGIHRIVLIVVTAVFLMAAFSSNFVYRSYDVLPAPVVWLMVSIYNLIVVDIFSSIGLDSPFWWGLGSGISTAFVIGLLMWILSRSISWIYAGFKK
jgi:hypothetical protein